jgi:nitrile hydratase alpha subunit
MSMAVRSRQRFISVSLTDGGFNAKVIRPEALTANKGGDMAQKQAEEDLNKQLTQIIKKAWADPTFKKRLLEDPKAIAQEHGIHVPQDLEVLVVENTKTRVHVVLPVQPPDELLSEEALMRIVGGATSDPPYSSHYGPPPPPSPPDIH